VRVKIEYDITATYNTYRVFAKNKWFHYWQYVEGFKTLDEAKQYAEKLFTRAIYPLIYRSETEIK